MPDYLLNYFCAFRWIFCFCHHSISQKRLKLVQWKCLPLWLICHITIWFHFLPDLDCQSQTKRVWVSFLGCALCYAKNYSHMKSTHQGVHRARRFVSKQKVEKHRARVCVEQCSKSQRNQWSKSTPAEWEIWCTFEVVFCSPFGGGTSRRGERRKTNSWDWKLLRLPSTAEVLCTNAISVH